VKGLWLESGRLLFRSDLPRPRPAHGEALIRVRRAALCATDAELAKGYYPFTGVPGHEFVGVVEEGPTDWIGARVVGEINAACGDCAMCKREMPTHCSRRTVLGIVDRDGAFAEYLRLPLGNLHRVPRELDDDTAVFTEPLAAALQVLDQVNVRPGDRVLVVGDGKLGQLVAQVLQRTGCELTVLGRHSRKLALLSSRGIATVNEPPEGGIDVAVECSGNASGFAAARRALRPRGTLVMKSTYAGALTFDASAIVVDEITMVGSRCGPFGPALELLTRRAVDVKPLIEALYPLDRAIEAFEHAQRRGSLKILIGDA
jgi:threonine dehydrogenase-like Zn-dependent dehydrogenase